MERFTTKTENGNVLALRYGSVQPWVISEGDGFNYPRYTIAGSAIDQLAAYEETGLTPEQVKDMNENASTSLLTWFEAHYGYPIGELMGIMEAKQENRLIALPPCKIGDDVWIIYGDEIHKLRVQGMTLTITNKVLLHFGGYPITCIYALELGKKWFLSREEANAALKEKL